MQKGNLQRRSQRVLYLGLTEFHHRGTERTETAIQKKGLGQMLGIEDYLVLKNWFDQGVSIREIVRQTGYNRKTIRKYVHSSSPPVYRKRARKASKLDEYRDYITGRLQEHPLSAKRIYDEILERGFTGKYSIVKEFVRETKRKIRAP
jgi:transposase